MAHHRPAIPLKKFTPFPRVWKWTAALVVIALTAYIAMRGWAGTRVFPAWKTIPAIFAGSALTAFWIAGFVLLGERWRNRPWTFFLVHLFVACGPILLKLYLLREFQRGAASDEMDQAFSNVAFAATIYGAILIAIAAIGWHHYARREKTPPGFHPLTPSVM